MATRVTAKISIVITGTFVAMEGGVETDPITIPLRSRAFLVAPNRLRNLQPLIRNALEQCNKRADELKASKSGYTLQYCNAISLELVETKELARL